MLRSQNNQVRMFIDPNWREIVQAEDREYIGEILADFRQRIQSDPKYLFEQVKSLVVGPLQTHSEGNSLAEHPLLLERCGKLVE